MAKKLTEEDFIQALDYSYVLSVAYCNTMERCYAIKNKNIKKAFNKAASAMFDVYQVIGKESLKYDKT